MLIPEQTSSSEREPRLSRGRAFQAEKTAKYIAPCSKVSITNTEQEVLCSWSKVKEWTVATEEIRR